MFKGRLFEGHHLIEEQEIVIEEASQFEHMKIEALAGTGKTTILKAIAKFAMPDEKGLYLAFNKDIVKESLGDFPYRVTSKTTHGLAYQYTGFEYNQKGRLNRRLSSSIIANKFKITKPTYGLSSLSFCSYALEIISNFCNSASEHINWEHTNSIIIKPFSEADQNLIMQAGGILAMKIWNEMMNMNSNLPITHDVYLKKWALSNPKLDYDYILFDEAQDANPLILDVLLKQDSLFIAVGDRYQQIYSWRNAVNAMQELNIEKECFLSQSFRFGHEIADIATQILQKGRNSERKLIGFDKIESKVCKIGLPNVVICRTNSEIMKQAMSLISLDIPVYISGGVNPLISLLKSAQALMYNKKVYNPQLASFRDWKEVVEYSKTPSGTDLRTLVNIVKKNRISNIINNLKKVSSLKPEDASISLITAHKSKGREFNKVQLANDFSSPENTLEVTDEENNLKYVAATRAKHILDVSACNGVQYLLRS